MIPNTISKRVLTMGVDYHNPKGGIAQVLYAYSQIFETFRFIPTTNSKNFFSRQMTNLNNKSVNTRFKLNLKATIYPIGSKRNKNSTYSLRQWEIFLQKEFIHLYLSILQCKNSLPHAQWTLCSLYS